MKLNKNNLTDFLKRHEGSVYEFIKYQSPEDAEFLTKLLTYLENTLE